MPAAQAERAWRAWQASKSCLVSRHRCGYCMALHSIRSYAIRLSVHRDRFLVSAQDLGRIRGRQVTGTFCRIVAKESLWLVRSVRANPPAPLFLHQNAPKIAAEPLILFALKVWTLACRAFAFQIGGARLAGFSLRNPLISINPGNGS